MTQPAHMQPGELHRAVQDIFTGMVEDREISNALMAVLRRHGIDITRRDGGQYEVVFLSAHNPTRQPADTVGEAATLAIRALVEKLSGANNGA